ncbi:unnamed protein product [Blepharisma stoltei]|uniref:Uncharacterized protein n=1 Tax=Blepharisma stoltei TaxID=1481888 RepID=A0AAU9IM54_9CILI|nr:unnamed protein product [Blepharisma stoltei]
MSDENASLPILIIFLGADMIRILNNRISEQNISLEKGMKLKQDLISRLYSYALIEELFKPQKLFSIKRTKEFFEGLFKTSPLRPRNGIDKLFKMMIMNLKLHLLTLIYPEELFAITLKSIEDLKMLVPGTEEENLIKNAKEIAMDTYHLYHAAGYNRIKQSLCLYIQNKSIKIANFLQDGSQSLDGSFKFEGSQAPPCSEIPGKITKYGQNGEIERTRYVELALTSRYKKHKLFSRRPGVSVIKEEAKEENKEMGIKLRTDIAKWELNHLASMVAEKDGENQTIPVIGFPEGSSSPIKVVEERKIKEEKSVIDNSKINKFIAEIGGELEPAENTVEDVFELIE